MKHIWPIVLFISFLFGAIPSYAEIYKGEPYSAERRDYSLGWYLVQFVSNQEKDLSGKPISQTEISRFSYLLHYYQFSLEELVQAQETLLAEAKYQGIALEDVADALRVLLWHIDVKQGMIAHEQKTTMRCKFGAYAELDREMEKMKRNKAKREEVSTRDLDLEQAWQDAFGEETLREQKVSEQRQVLGLCWDAEKYRD